MINEIRNDAQPASYPWSCIRTFLFFYMFPNSVGIGASSYIGFAVGAKLEKVVHNLIIISLSSTLFVIVIVSAIG